MALRFPTRSGCISFVTKLASGRQVAAAAFTIAALGFGGCAQSPQQLAEVHHPKEYFPSSVYGAASRRVVADGQPVPHGGGQYLVGKPYTIAGQTYYPSERKVTQVGLASWYGDAFHGRLTANGEVYDRDGFTAAHPTMPLPSYARVTNLRNNASMIVRVNDRGPYHANRVMDVSRRVAEALDFERGGTAKVKVEYVGRASLAGSDDAKLYATLRTDGPARIAGVEAPQVAEPAPRMARVASLEPYAPAPAARRAEASDEEGESRRPIRSTHAETAVPTRERAAAVSTMSEPASKRDAIRGASARREHATKVASREEAARLPAPKAGKTPAQHAVAPVANEKQHAPSKQIARGPHPAPAVTVLPPARPASVAAAASSHPIRHAALGLRLTRSRED